MSNAGIGANGSVETCEEAVWDRVIAVNLKGMFLIAKFAVPQLRAAGGGAIVNTASVSGMWGEPDTVAYNASKGGVIAMTRAMAMDLALTGSASTRSVLDTTRRVCRPSTSQRIPRATRWCGV